MEADFINIFQSLAYPVAVSVLLFAAIGYFSKKLLEDMKQREVENIKLRDKFIEYLQDTQKQLTTVINENAIAYKENAVAFKETSMAINKFSIILEKIEKKMDNNNSKND